MSWGDCYFLGKSISMSRCLGSLAWLALSVFEDGNRGLSGLEVRLDVGRRKLYTASRRAVFGRNGAGMRASFLYSTMLFPTFTMLFICFPLVV